MCVTDVGLSLPSDMDANLSTIESSKGWRIDVVNDLEAYISCTKHWKLANNKNTFQVLQRKVCLCKVFQRKDSSQTIKLREEHFEYPPGN